MFGTSSSGYSLREDNISLRKVINSSCSVIPEHVTKQLKCWGVILNCS